MLVKSVSGFTKREGSREKGQTDKKQKKIASLEK